MSVDGRYSMLVCENGHVITDMLEDLSYNDKFCSICGARTISRCPSCDTRIRGAQSGVIVVGYVTPPPQYCPECGAPMPWTQSKMEAMKELAELDDGLSDGDKVQFMKSATATLSENPKTKVSAFNVKKILGKMGKETASAIRDLLVDMVAESAKRIIWPS